MPFLMNDYRPDLVLVSEVEGVREGWRLPTMEELLSIVDETQACPTIDPVAFPDTPKATFWTSSPCEDDPGHAWVVDFAIGEPDTEMTECRHFVRLCRRTGIMEKWPPGTIYDSRTSLLWQRFVIAEAWDENQGKGLGNAVRITWEEAVRRFGGARQSNVTRRRFG